MLKHSRITTVPDVTRMGKATAQPGIDPRTWISYASVEAVGIDSEGVFADLQMLPTGSPITARLGSAYAGAGFGLYTPITVGDEVIVEVPDGDPLHGGVITARVHSPSDPLPQAAIDNPSDVILVVKDGQSVRLVISGGGKVVLGSADASRGVARIDDEIKLDLSSLQACLDLRYQQLPLPPPGPPPLLVPVTGTVTSASDTVVSE